jgi:hypothetical protein
MVVAEGSYNHSKPGVLTIFYADYTPLLEIRANGEKDKIVDMTKNSFFGRSQEYTADKAKNVVEVFGIKLLVSEGK